MISRRAALGALAGLAAGCSARSANSRTLRFCAVGREGEIAAELVRDFEREHPGIEVDLEKLPWTAAHEKLLTAYAGDTLPDLCQLGNTWVPEFAALNALEPLGQRAAGSGEVVLGDYFDGFVQSNRIDGELYGIPWYIDTKALFYRRDLLAAAGFDAPPRRWSEWSAMMAAVKKSVGPDRYAVLLPLNEFEPLLVLALQQPGDLLRDGGRWGNFRSADFRRALQFYADIFAHDWAPKMSNTQISNVWDEFGKGFFSFYIGGPWNIAEFRKRMPEPLKGAWGTAPMPGPDGPGVSTAGGSSLVIFRSSIRKREAWLLAEFLSRPGIQERFYGLTGNMPPRRSTWRSEALASSVEARAFREQLDRVRTSPMVPEWERIAQQMRLAGERVVQGVSSIDEAVAALDRTTDEILEKRRWMLEHGRRPA